MESMFYLKHFMKSNYYFMSKYLSKNILLKIIIKKTRGWWRW